ncbi:MAG TPA: ribonuclease III [Methylophilaceae bacterium]|nr:ribonuclease III [Methylophilaceae bacterium]
MSQNGLASLIAYDFQNKSLLIQALTHRSHSGANNERLEFLGDGVLNFIIAHQLFQRYPKLSEGDLSRLRAQLVKESTLSEIAITLNIGESLRLGEGELKSSGWRRPSVLADALEAIIGAVFIDGGFAATEAFVVNIYTPLFKQINPKSIGKDPKSLLQEYLQGRKMDLPEYTVLATEGDAHCQVFRVECHIPKLKITAHGEAASRRSAEQQAAELAYNKISAAKGRS